MHLAKPRPPSSAFLPMLSVKTRRDLTSDDQLSENNDFCSACGGSGFLLCCDGCDRSFHFSCLDPPLSEDASELNEPWYCYICVAKRPVFDSPEKPPPGLFSALFSTLKKRNPSNFALPQDIREYFEGVATDKNGQFVEAVNTRTRNKVGYEEPPDLTRTKDSKGNTILCYSCGTASHGNRQIIQCDYCGENWHLDCLDPPLANPPARNLEGRKVHDWMCPLHADHELRRLDASLLNHRDAGRRRKVHIRKPRNAKVVETALRRGVRNNGIVEVVDDESEDSGSEFYEEESQDNKSVVLRLPVSGIKLDFIDKVKQTRVQHLRTEHAYRRAQVAAAAPKQLEQANFARRTFMEKQMALNLAQFANANKDLNLGSDQVENLVGTLIAEAPQQVVDEMMAAEEQERARSASSAIPPSPPASEQPDQLSAAQRKDLQMLQELIRRRLEGAKT
ncbi:hypothetical protein BDY17DRAFT_3385 [Neohortaea acidophila]|uniref:PHD-type domain-containing protein n=1 Tax=Neohortaea acidophila TaxID=245834 RepID=A0A6A6Q488_9PEZI|nr:uncharacterized protein BDY17DRAFT_3385 [Neohortaea acidophila]KAF2487115.1 hypothetical protein BDY17DRAFT_3385 [Neohortaea acidophila]